jgi:hypothetical protein
MKSIERNSTWHRAQDAMNWADGVFQLMVVIALF